MKTLPVFVMLLAFLATPAHAQWAWKDADGHINYSDSPPPPGTPPASILRQPTLTPEPRAGSGNDASSGYGSPVPDVPPGRADGGTSTAPNPADLSHRPPAGPKTLAEQDAEFRKRMADRAKAEQKEADDEARASQRAASCEQARGYVKMIEEGTRLMRPGPDGERNFMDDEQRAAELQKAQDTVARDCS
jgi:hypothetical protein